MSLVNCVVFTPSDRLPLCRSLLLLLCPPVTRSTLRRESPASVQTCLATKHPCLPCQPAHGCHRCKAPSCPCCRTASCPVTLASGTLRTSTSLSPPCQVGATSSVSDHNEAVQSRGVSWLAIMCGCRLSGDRWGVPFSGDRRTGPAAAEGGSSHGNHEHQTRPSSQDLCPD